ncbi:MAG: ribosomal-protein-alanine N-acetyltransferase [Bacillus thermozeamaize]|uniref:Ribosomal-protein-alanine N-acetyltransferase n=1 Tax=Bacillus thermozeamaize TaxID=230954 RepID=A0A1Y3PDW5_9BACI|nr:MAG: ribosomal-protein-alanine N-acetyltransferase [Bacillus thermozeamaize]
MNERVQVRPMRLEDIDDVWEVERAAFPNPWSKQAYYNELVLNKSAHYLVLLVEGKIRGYGGMWVLIDEAHITNVAIHPEVQGRRLGWLLMGTLMVWARSLGAERMTLEVRVSNVRAQNLYNKLGFVVTGVRPQYYTDNLEDALIMWATLDEGRLSSLFQHEWKDME